MRKLLVKAFGPDVNIANVIETEALRVWLCVTGPTVVKADLAKSALGAGS